MSGWRPTPQVAIWRGAQLSLSLPPSPLPHHCFSPSFAAMHHSTLASLFTLSLSTLVVGYSNHTTGGFHLERRASSACTGTIASLDDVSNAIKCKTVSLTATAGIRGSNHRLTCSATDQHQGLQSPFRQDVRSRNPRRWSYCERVGRHHVRDWQRLGWTPHARCAELLESQPTLLTPHCNTQSLERGSPGTATATSELSRRMESHPPVC